MSNEKIVTSTCLVTEYPVATGGGAATAGAGGGGAHLLSCKCALYS